MSQQQRDTNLARPRLQRVLPHLVALIAGGTALWGWGSVIGADLLKGPVIGLAYLVVLMFAPVIGASAVTYSQGRAPQEERHRVLIPYIWWAIAGLGSLLLLILAGMNPRSTAPAPPVVTIAFWAVFASMWVVPVIVPSLRTLIWLVSPPAINTDTEGRPDAP